MISTSQLFTSTLMVLFFFVARCTSQASMPNIDPLIIQDWPLETENYDIWDKLHSMSSTIKDKIQTPSNFTDIANKSHKRTMLNSYETKHENKFKDIDLDSAEWYIIHISSSTPPFSMFTKYAQESVNASNITEAMLYTILPFVAYPHDFFLTYNSRLKRNSENRRLKEFNREKRNQPHLASPHSTFEHSVQTQHATLVENLEFILKQKSFIPAASHSTKKATDIHHVTNKFGSKDSTEKTTDLTLSNPQLLADQKYFYSTIWASFILSRIAQLVPTIVPSNSSIGALLWLSNCTKAVQNNQNISVHDFWHDFERCHTYMEQEKYTQAITHEISLHIHAGMQQILSSTHLNNKLRKLNTRNTRNRYHLTESDQTKPTENSLNSSKSINHSRSNKYRNKQKNTMKSLNNPFYPMWMRVRLNQTTVTLLRKMKGIVSITRNVPLRMGPIITSNTSMNDSYKSNKHRFQANHRVLESDISSTQTTNSPTGKRTKLDQSSSSINNKKRSVSSSSVPDTKIIGTEKTSSSCTVPHRSLSELENTTSLQCPIDTFDTFNNSSQWYHVTSDVLPWNIDRIGGTILDPFDDSYYHSKLDSGHNVIVYVVDSGIRASHEAFRNGQIIGGIDIVRPNSNDNGLVDCAGHGTHVAGTIAGEFVGVALNASLFSVRIFGCEKYGSAIDLLDALSWISTDVRQRYLTALDNHQKLPRFVVNLSLGFSSRVLIIEQYIRALQSDGIVFVIAAGNDNTDACLGTPSAIHETITVAASDQNDIKSWFSNWGECVDVVAPGVNIISASNNSNSGYRELSGTSMSTPLVSGLVARYLSLFPYATPFEVSASMSCSSFGTTYGGLGPYKNGALGFLDTPNLLIHYPPMGHWDTSFFVPSLDTGLIEMLRASRDGLRLDCTLCSNSTMKDTYYCLDMCKNHSIVQNISQYGYMVWNEAMKHVAPDRRHVAATDWHSLLYYPIALENYFMDDMNTSTNDIIDSMDIVCLADNERMNTSYYNHDGAISIQQLLQLNNSDTIWTMNHMPNISPQISSICKGKPCKNACSNVGLCWDGICQCPCNRVGSACQAELVLHELEGNNGTIYGQNIPLLVPNPYDNNQMAYQAIDIAGDTSPDWWFKLKIPFNTTKITLHTCDLETNFDTTITVSSECPSLASSVDDWIAYSDDSTWSLEWCTPDQISYIEYPPPHIVLEDFSTVFQGNPQSNNLREYDGRLDWQLDQVDVLDMLDELDWESTEIQQPEWWLFGFVEGSGSAQGNFGLHWEIATWTPIPSASPSPSISATPSVTSSVSVTPSATTSMTSTTSITPSMTPTPSITPSMTSTSSIIPSMTSSPSGSPTSSTTPSMTSTPSGTPTSSITPSKTSTPSGTATSSTTTSMTSSPSGTPTSSITSSMIPTSSMYPTSPPSASRATNVPWSTSTNAFTSPSLNLISPTSSCMPSGTSVSDSLITTAPDVSPTITPDNTLVPSVTKTVPSVQLSPLPTVQIACSSNHAISTNIQVSFELQIFTSIHSVWSELFNSGQLVQQIRNNLDILLLQLHSNVTDMFSLPKTIGMDTILQQSNKQQHSNANPNANPNPNPSPSPTSGPGIYPNQKEALDNFSDPSIPISWDNTIEIDSQNGNYENPTTERTMTMERNLNKKQSSTNHIHSIHHILQETSTDNECNLRWNTDRLHKYGLEHLVDISMNISNVGKGTLSMSNMNCQEQITHTIILPDDLQQKDLVARRFFEVFFLPDCLRSLTDRESSNTLAQFMMSKDQIQTIKEQEKKISRQLLYEQTTNIDLIVFNVHSINGISLEQLYKQLNYPFPEGNTPSSTVKPTPPTEAQNTTSSVNTVVIGIVGTLSGVMIVLFVLMYIKFNRTRRIRRRNRIRRRRTVTITEFEASVEEHNVASSHPTTKSRHNTNTRSTTNNRTADEPVYPSERDLAEIQFDESGFCVAPRQSRVARMGSQQQFEAVNVLYQNDRPAHPASKIQDFH